MTATKLQYDSLGGSPFCPTCGYRYCEKVGGTEPANAVERGVQEDLRERGLCGIIFDHEGVRSMCVREAPCELHAGGSPSEGTAPFALPVRVEALTMPDAWAVYDASGDLVAEHHERDRADFIARALNAPRSEGREVPASRKCVECLGSVDPDGEDWRDVADGAATVCSRKCWDHFAARYDTPARSTGESEALDANEVMRLADQMAEARFCEGCEEREGGSDRRAGRAYFYTRYTEARTRLFDLVARALAARYNTPARSTGEPETRVHVYYDGEMQAANVLLDEPPRPVGYSVVVARVTPIEEPSDE